MTRSPFGQVQASPTTQIVPSSSALEAMIARAMARCDADVEQAAHREEAKRLARMESVMVAEAKARAGRWWRT